MGVATFCQIAQPITYSSRDTPETRAQIIQHNCLGFHACGWPGSETACKVSP